MHSDLDKLLHDPLLDEGAAERAACAFVHGYVRRVVGCFDLRCGYSALNC